MHLSGIICHVRWHVMNENRWTGLWLTNRKYLSSSVIQIFCNSYPNLKCHRKTFAVITSTSSPLAYAPFIWVVTRSVETRCYSYSIGFHRGLMQIGPTFVFVFAANDSISQNTSLPTKSFADIDIYSKIIKLLIYTTIQ